MASTRETRRLLPAMPLLDLDMVSTAKLNGRKMDATIVEAVGGLKQSLTIEGANVLTLTINDPRRVLLRKDLIGRQLDLDFGRAGRWRMDRSRDVGGLSINGNLLTLRFWDLTAAAMRARTGLLSVNSARVDIGGFARLLTTEVKADVRPRILVPYPGEVPDLEKRDAPSRKSGGEAAGFSAKVRLKGKVDDNGKYGYLSRDQLKNAATVLETAADEKAPPKATLALVMACLVEGPDFTNSKTVTDGTSVGILQAQSMHGPVDERMDIGKMSRKFLRKGFASPKGAIELARENPTWSAGEIAATVQGPLESLRGRYDKQRDHAKAIIEAWAGSSSSGGGSGTVSRPAQWRRGTSQQRESSWLALEREAKRLGRRRFVALPWLNTPRLVVAADQQLIRAQPHLTIDGLDDDLLTAPPSIDLDGIAQLQTVDLSVVASGWSAPPGAAVHLRNAGPADGPWIVKSVDLEAGAAVAPVILQQPTTTVEVQADQTTAGGRKRSSSRRRSGGSSLFEVCKAISDRKLPYGAGGHGQSWSAAKKASTMDCSSSTSVALNEIGLMKGATGPRVSDWFLSWGKAGRGQEFTVWVKPGTGANGHVCILLEGDKAGWRFDTGSVDALGRGPRLRNTPRSTAGMQPRHWPGH
jgi:hypothetical protein